MKPNRAILLASSAGLLILLYFWLGRSGHQKRQNYESKTDSTALPFAPATTPTKSPNPSVAPTPPATQGDEAVLREERVKTVQSVFAAPISFYGKVLDQNGNPVPEAHIEYSAIDKFWADGSRYQGTSDDNGNFSISDIKGAGLLVTVGKNGYDSINGKSSQAFGYGMPPDSSRKSPPTKDTPSIFVLRKKVIGEPLFTVARTFRIPRNGSPVEINLKTAISVPAGQGDLVIACWTNDQEQDANRHYDWQCRFSVPGGGLVQSQDETDYQAPIEGYQPSVEISMPHNAENWRSDVSGEYYLKLANGTYARAKINMIAGGDHFVRITSYLNPQQGSRNLEYDPAQQVNLK